MRKFLIVAAIMIYGNLQSMWNESKFKTVFPRPNYAASEIVKETMIPSKNRGTRSEPKHLHIISSTPNHCVLSWDLSDISQLSSDFSITSPHIEDNNNFHDYDSSFERFVRETELCYPDVSYDDESFLDTSSTSQSSSPCSSQEEIFYIDMSYDDQLFCDSSAKLANQYQEFDAEEIFNPDMIEDTSMLKDLRSTPNINRIDPFEAEILDIDDQSYGGSTLAEYSVSGRHIPPSQYESNIYNYGRSYRSSTSASTINSSKSKSSLELYYDSQKN